MHQQILRNKHEINIYKRTNLFDFISIALSNLTSNVHYIIQCSQHIIENSYNWLLLTELENAVFKNEVRNIMEVKEFNLYTYNTQRKIDKGHIHGHDGDSIPPTHKTLLMITCTTHKELTRHSLMGHTYNIRAITFIVDHTLPLWFFCVLFYVFVLIDSTHAVCSKSITHSAYLAIS